MQLSQSLRVRSYPYTALLAFSGSRTRLMTAAEGCFAPLGLLPLLQQAQDSQSSTLVAEQIEQTEQVLYPPCRLDEMMQLKGIESHGINPRYPLDSPRFPGWVSDNCCVKDVSMLGERSVLGATCLPRCLSRRRLTKFTAFYGAS